MEFQIEVNNALPFKCILDLEAFCSKHNFEIEVIRTLKHPPSLLVKCTPEVKDHIADLVWVKDIREYVPRYLRVVY